MSNLQEHVEQWAKEQAEDGYEGALDDLVQHGCQSGMVGHLIYYIDTVAFYEKHQEEIDALLQELCENLGQRPDDIFGDKWDSYDPLARSDFNKNLLAWFGFEETAIRLAETLGN